jgi:hypothetical protein
MTDADKPAFLQALARLAIAHREKEPDVVQMRVYFDALKHCAIEFVVEAANRLMAAEFFPRAGAWLREAQAVERERGEAQRALLRKLPTPLCSACADTGWATTQTAEPAPASAASCDDRNYSADDRGLRCPERRYKRTPSRSRLRKPPRRSPR